jgi:hypothetical protein
MDNLPKSQKDYYHNKIREFEKRTGKSMNVKGVSKIYDCNIEDVEYNTPAAIDMYSGKEATRDGAPPIDLVDGDELAEKLKELSLGVTTELVPRVVVNPEWFEGLSHGK